MKFTALLPMKGESERVPNKNIRLFNGKPLLLHVLEKLQTINAIETIIVNTDSDEIQSLCESFSKVILHKRPEHLIGNLVPMNDIIDYDIQMSGSQFFIQTHSTNPLINSIQIEKALNIFSENQKQFDSLFSVTKLQTRLYWENGEAINHNPNELLRTQDLPPVFEENSNFFIFSKSSFEAAGKKRIGLKPKMFEINKLESLDIDDEEDFLLAEMAQKILLK